MSERPSPRSIAICGLVALRSDPSSPFHDIELGPDAQESLTSFLQESVFSDEKSRHNLSSAVNEGKWTPPSRCASHSAFSLTLWLETVYRRAGREVTDLIMDTLDMASESVDSLLDLMESLKAAIAEGLIDAVSAHGVYLRQICLGFEELSFESVSFLWQELNDELDQADEMIRLVGNQTAPVESPASEGAIDEGYYRKFNEDLLERNWPLSTEQVADVLRKHCLEHREGGIFYQSYEAVDSEVRKMLEKDPDVPSAYFLRFLNCMRHKERVGALDALHQFFDHAMVKTSTPKEILQFSAILLAMAHSSFGDQGLALMATEEAVRVAQQSNDAACVAFSLGWLFENEGHGMLERRQLLQKCTTRAGQGQIRSLVTGSNLRLALHSLEEGENEPRDIWATLMEATAEPKTDGLPNLDRSTFLSSEPDETLAGLARQSFVAAGIWDAFGMPSLSGLASLVSIRSQHALSAAEVATALQNIGRLSSYGMSLGLCGATNAGTPSIFDESIENIMKSRKASGLVDRFYDKSFLPGIVLLMHERAVNMCDVSTAEALQTAFYSSFNRSMRQKKHLATRMGIQRCRLLCRQHNWEGARSLAEELLQSCVENKSKRQTVELLLEMSRIELESSSNQFCSAIPSLLEAIAICEESNMFGLHAIALSALARIFLRLKNPKRAIAILKASIPTLLQREEVWCGAEAYLTLAKAYIQRAGLESGSNVLKRYRESASALRRSQEMFEKCEDYHCLKEVAYLQARVLACLGRDDDCEDASRRFLDLNSCSSNTQKKIFPMETSAVAPDMAIPMKSMKI